MNNSLSRFVSAQDALPFRVALEELQSGQKRSHWIWFVFPQLRGLGKSPTSVYFGLDGREEAEAYIDHPLLSRRLRDCFLAVNDHAGKIGLEQLFGSPVDAMKFKSSAELFASLGFEPAELCCRSFGFTRAVNREEDKKGE